MKRTHARTGSKKAFTLIEVILSIGILSIAILTLVALVGAVFRQIEDVLQTNRAISVVKAIDSALSTPEIIAGTPIPKITDKSTPKFNALYNFLRTAVDGRKVTLFYFEKRITNAQNRSESVVSVIYNTNGGPFPRSTYIDQGGEGFVFRVDIGISKLLEQQRVELDESNKDDPVPSKTIYSGGALPGDASKYALAFLPLYVEVYPHNLTDSTENANIRPIIAQNIIVNR